MHAPQFQPHPRYEITGLIGNGDFAAVYRARDLELGRDVAIKQIHQQYLSDPRRLERFWREAQLLAKLEHPHIMTIYDIVRSHGWLVLELTNSAFAVGLVSTLGSLPILLFTLYGGVVADRVDRHRFLIVLQSLMLIEALVLGSLVALDRITVEWVMILAVLFGLLAAFEVPVRQAFTADMVGKDDLMNAIALNSSAFNVARVIGPSIAGALIATVGLAACFYVNAASYLAVLTGLLLMRVRRPAVPSRAPALGALKEGFGYIFGNPWPRALVTIVAG